MDTVGNPWVARPHTLAHGTGARNRHGWAETRQEATNTDLVIRAHGSGACYCHTANDKIAERRSVLLRNTDLTIMVLPTRPSSTTLATKSIVHNHGREKVGWNASLHGWKVQIKGSMTLTMLTLSLESADPLSTTQMIPCHQESQRQPHQCQTC